MKQIIFAAVMVTALFLVGSAQAQKSEFDLVLANGRVMDPESNLDAVRYVGIREGKIAAISTRPLSGRTVIHVKGLVIAPGFIDLHSHGQDDENYRYKARDGVHHGAGNGSRGIAGGGMVRRARRQGVDQLRRNGRPHPGEDGGDERHRRVSTPGQRYKSCGDAWKRFVKYPI
jgi:cytosine/adenosine deaminase-related metal-dependent hydrolase